MDGISELARMLKERENPRVRGITIGEVVEPLPDIKVKLGDKIVLTTKHLVIAAHIYIHYEWTDGVSTYYLEHGDKVILMPVPDEQIYYLIDKVG